MDSNPDIQSSPNDGTVSAHDDVTGKIFVGGLSWQTTEESMRYHFEKFGELTDIAIMTDKRTGQPRGFGFITMKDPAVADIIVSTEHTIDGRVVDVKRAVPRDLAPAPTRPESKKIFVGGLPSECTEKEFGEYFSQFGNVKDAVVMVDRNTNRSRGFGFITFEHEESVDAVMRIKCEIMGKWVEVKRAEPRDSRESAMRGAVGAMGGGVGAGYGGGGAMRVGVRGMPIVGAPGIGGVGFGGPRNNAMIGGDRRFQQQPQQQGYGGRNMIQEQQVAYGGGAYGGQQQQQFPRGAPAAAAAGGYRSMGAVRGYPAAAGYGAATNMGGNPAAMGYYGAAGGYGAYGATTGPGGYGAQNGNANAGGRGPGGDIGAGIESGQSNGVSGGYDQVNTGGYGNAAAMQQAYSYGAAAMAGYGGAYNMATGYGGANNIQGILAGQNGQISPNGNMAGARGGQVSLGRFQ